MTSGIVLRDVSRRYGATVALDGVSLRVLPGEFLAVVGPSGGGKSTLLNVIGLIDKPDVGETVVNGVSTTELDDDALAKLRSDTVAFIFQNFHLIDSRPAIDSVELGLLYRGVAPEERRRRALEAMATVGLSGLEQQLARTLSGGQRQRVAIARAIATGAPVVLADEPTGNLDSVSGTSIVRELRRLSSTGTTVVVVTHDESIARLADRQVRLVDGRVVARTGSDPSAGEDTGMLAQMPPGAPSRLRPRDLVADAVRTLASRIGRTVSLTASVAIGVALTVGTLGISTSASTQVSATFDAHANRDVSVELPAGVSEATASLVGKLKRLSGVEAAAVLSSYDARAIRVNTTRPAFDARVYLASSEYARAGRLSVHWASGHHGWLTHDEILVGEQLAEQLRLGPLNAQPTIEIDGASALRVVGVIDDSPRYPSQLGEVIASADAAEDLHTGPPSRRLAVILTRAGAAQQVARQAPFVIDPYRPQSLVVTAPIDPTTLRVEIEESLRITLILLSTAAVVAGTIGLVNATALAIGQRRSEIGLRRALGARRLHISLMVFVESAVVGVLGGVVGLIIGMFAVLIVTIAERWRPTFDLGVAPVALLLGIAVGALGGIAAALRAGRIQPAEALRQ